MTRSTLSAARLRRPLRLGLVLLLVTTGVGSAEGSTLPSTMGATPQSAPAHPGGHRRLVSISLSPDSAALMPRQTLRFVAKGYYSDGSIKDVTRWARWRSSDASVVALRRRHRGLAKAIAEGTATITATVRRVTGSASVTVGGSTATLESIEITPKGSTIAEGGTVQYAARGQYSDATSRDITATVSWSSSDVVTASIDAAGLATGLRSGTTTIEAAMDGVSDSVVLAVSPRIDSIDVTPHDPSISVGDDVQFEVLAHFTDGSSSDASPSFVWSSSDATVATIDATGLATGLAEGTTTITASCDDEGRCSSLQASTMLQVSPLEPPTSPEGTSQDLIERDLADGIIDHPTSLEYRTWALFRDLRLPARYAGLPSAGEDQGLFDQLDKEFDTLPPAAQASIEPYLVPPDDPASAFGPAPAVAQPFKFGMPAADGGFSDTLCHEPATWRFQDWTPPGGGDDDGFRIWVCASRDAEAQPVWELVRQAASPLWAPMTLPEPEGMGKPVPDTVNKNPTNFGNGKIDIWVVFSSECVDRTCPLIPQDGGRFHLGVARKLPATCGASGYPPKSCSGYLVLNAGLLGAPNLQGTIAHEFFHVLQAAHNAQAGSRVASAPGAAVPSFEMSWYVEASAQWAGWYYARDPDSYPYFKHAFQQDNLSLLDYGTHQHQYGSWVWPLLMQEKEGASTVFRSWQMAESATAPKGLDDAVDAVFPFAKEFRDFSVRDLQPAEYMEPANSGLEANTWQSDVGDFPTESHLLVDSGVISLGDQQVPAKVAVLAAQDNAFTFADRTVRQVTIDIGSLTNAPNADLDIVGRLASDGGGRSTWDRIRVSGTKVTFCRDSADQDFDLVYVVLSNHGRARDPKGGPDLDDAALARAYTIKAKDHCDVPVAYEGSFHSTWTEAIGTRTIEGTARFEPIGGLDCGFPWVAYCYFPVSADVTLTWGAYPEPPNGRCTIQPHGPLHLTLPQDDPPLHGSIQVRDRSTDPKDDTYAIGLYSAGAGPTMPATRTCPEGTEEIELGIPNTWIIAPDDYGRTGWLLTGSYQASAQTPLGMTSISETWEFQPIFDDA